MKSKLITASLFFTIALIGSCFYYQKIYEPKQVSIELFDQVFGLTKVYDQSFSNNWMTIKQYQLSPNALHNLQSKDTVFWQQFSLCPIRDEKAKHVEQICKHWEDSISPEKYANQETFKAKVFSDLTTVISFSEYAIKKNEMSVLKEGEFVSLDLMKIMNLKTTKFLIENISTDEGHITDYKINVMCLATGKIYRIYYSLWNTI